MNKIEIKTFATWESLTDVLGKQTTPLLLQIDIENNTNEIFIIDSICISIKHSDSFTDVLKQTKSYLINPKNTFSFKLDVKHLFNNYSIDEKFKIKVVSNNEIFESDIVYLGTLKAFNDKKDLI